MPPVSNQAGQAAEQAQRQRRGWRDSFAIIALFLAKRAPYASGKADVRLEPVLGG